MALTPAGFLYSWGQNVFGQLGLGDYNDRNAPELVKSLAEHVQVKKISAGYLHSGILDDRGKLYTWGHNPDCRLFKKIERYKKTNNAKNFALP